MIALRRQSGIATVIDVRDRSNEGKVMLDFGSWATPDAYKDDGSPYKIPPKGTTVNWCMSKDVIWYSWDEWVEEMA